MKKMTTLFVVTYHKKGEMGIISEEVRPENIWVFTDPDKVTATVKFDGSAAMVKAGILYKRYDCKRGKLPPEGAIPCQEPDEISGHWPHWVSVNADNPADRYFTEAYDPELPDGTYELCGEKVGVNAERITGHKLLKHGSVTVDIPSLSFESIKEYLANPMHDIEGIVFHHEDGRMCKIRKSDFGYIR